MEIKDIKQQTGEIFRKYSVSFAGVFGSVARGEGRSDSDIDFLVEFSKTPSLVQFIRMENELKEKLNKQVDLVVKGSEKDLIKPAIYRDLISIYGQGSAI